MKWLMCSPKPNSYISCAVQNVWREHPHITRLTTKYSVPGHSCIQEMDNAHSLIEMAMAFNKFYSPLGLIRLLKTINRKSPIHVLQMTDDDFFDWWSFKISDFQARTIFKVCTTDFCQTLHEMKFKTSFTQEDQTAHLRFMQPTSRNKPTKSRY